MNNDITQHTHKKCCKEGYKGDFMGRLCMESPLELILMHVMCLPQC